MVVVFRKVKELLIFGFMMCLFEIIYLLYLKKLVELGVLYGVVFMILLFVYIFNCDGVVFYMVFVVGYLVDVYYLVWFWLLVIMILILMIIIIDGVVNVLFGVIVVIIIVFMLIGLLVDVVLLLLGVDVFFDMGRIVFNVYGSMMVVVVVVRFFGLDDMVVEIVMC